MTCENKFEGIVSDFDIESIPIDDENPDEKIRDQKASEAYINSINALRGHIYDFYEFLTKEQTRAQRSPGRYTNGMSLPTVINASRQVMNIENALFSVFGNSGYSGVSTLSKLGASPDCPIQACVEKNTILIQMPRLPVKSAPLPHLISDVLISKLISLNTPAWRIHHIEFYHVFNSDSILLAKDVDNYRYKEVIDAISIGLAAPDSARYCSYSTNTVCDDSWVPGTYIRVIQKNSFAALPEAFNKLT